MRMFIVSLVMLAILIGVGIVTTNAIDNICTEILDKTDNLAAAVNDLHIGDALDQSEDMGEEWREKEKVLAALVDHKYLGEVRLSIDKIRMSLMFNKPDVAAQNIAALRVSLTEIRSMGYVNLENIF